MNELAIPSLRERVAAARQSVVADQARGLPGIDVVRNLGTAIQQLVVEQLETVARTAPMPGVALIALGGFARRELAPFSDVDMVLLAPEGADAASLTHAVFTPLWDAGIEPGAAVRTRAQTLALAAEDHTFTTALLDARPLAGDGDAAADLIKSFWERLHGEALEAFVAAKVAEIEHRRSRFGGSVYLLEPNVKTGVGGLRDLAGGLWIARARHRNRGLSGIQRLALLPRREIESLRAARDTLWRIRCQLHIQAGRRDDRLTFAAQEQAAAALGYRDASEGLAVEHLMRDYYLAAHTVEHAADALIDRCVTEARIRKHYRPPVPLTEDLELFDGRVSFREHADPAARPLLLVELFAAAERERVQVLSAARDRVAQEVTKLGPALATDRAAMKAFLDYLVSPGATGQAIRGMYATGVLGGLFPELARLKARVQHDVYHVYTVDTHTVFALQMMLRLRAGLLSADRFTRVCQDIARPLPLYLGLFFHDLGKHLGGSHAVRGEELIRAWGERANVGGDTLEDAAFLVREHLRMSATAFRRDLADPALVHDFAQLLGTRERLEMLYLLTYVDISSVGPETWNDWRARLLGELYDKCRAVFDAESPQEPHLLRTQAAEAGAQALRALIRHPDPLLEELIRALPERYLATVPPAAAREHFELWKHARGRTVSVRLLPRTDLGDAGELVVIADDRPGLLSLIAGTMAAHSIDILGAEIFSLKDNRVLDSFVVREPGGQPPSAERVAGLQSDLERVLTGNETVEGLLSRRRGSRRLAAGPSVATRIRIDQKAARDATVVDIWAQDRIGLLHDVADAFRRADASIVLARIATEGTCATDGFYLQDFQGKKIVSPEHLERIQHTLEEAIRAG